MKRLLFAAALLTCVGCTEVPAAERPVMEANTNPFDDEPASCSPGGLYGSSLYYACAAFWF